jgi:hypothetical protein
MCPRAVQRSVAPTAAMCHEGRATEDDRDAPSYPNPLRHPGQKKIVPGGERSKFKSRTVIDSDSD